MNEQEQVSQLSALFDDELQPQQAEMVIRRAVKDAAMRAHWQRYALIGACVRGEPLAGAGTRHDVASRVRMGLAAEADIVAPGALGARRIAGARGFNGFLGRGAIGGAIAAGVAVLSVFVVRSMGTVPVDAGAVVAQGTTPATVEAPQLVAANTSAVPVGASAAPESAPRSYTTPGANSPATNALVSQQQPLAHYVVAHSEQAASSFGFSYDLAEGGVDMTQEEISARR